MLWMESAKTVPRPGMTAKCASMKAEHHMVGRHTVGEMCGGGDVSWGRCAAERHMAERCTVETCVVKETYSGEMHSGEARGEKDTQQRDTLQGDTLWRNTQQEIQINNKSSIFSPHPAHIHPHPTHAHSCFHGHAHPCPHLHHPRTCSHAQPLVEVATMSTRSQQPMLIGVLPALTHKLEGPQIHLCQQLYVFQNIAPTG